MPQTLEAHDVGSRFDDRIVDAMRAPASDDALTSVRVLGFHLDGTRPPLVAIRTWFEEIPSYTALARHLGPDQPIVTVAPPRGTTREEMPSTAQEWAAGCRAELEAIGLRGPWIVAGWSFGGVVALELARQLAAAGDDVRRVLMIDTWLPRHRTTNQPFARKLLHHLNELARLDAPARRAYLRGRIDKQVGLWRRRLLGRVAPQPTAKDDYGVDHITTNRGTTISLLRRTIFVTHYKYECEPTALPVSIFASESSREAWRDVSLGWASRLRGDCEIVVIPGEHFNVFAEPHVAVLADRVRRTLAACEH